MKKGLLIIAHGSRMGSSNREVVKFVKKVRENMSITNPNFFSKIRVSFLELAKPSIPMAISFLAEDEVQHIYIFPYFLAFGAHVSKDIPEIVLSTLKEINSNRKKLHKPEIKFTNLVHLGKMPKLSNVACNHIFGELKKTEK